MDVLNAPPARIRYEITENPTFRNPALGLEVSGIR
jgi:hypothetical protein